MLSPLCWTWWGRAWPPCWGSPRGGPRRTRRRTGRRRPRPGGTPGPSTAPEAVPRPPSYSIKEYRREVCDMSSVVRIRNVYPGSRIRLFSIPDPGSATNNLSILTQKNGFKAPGNMIRVVHPGSLLFTHPGSRIQGSKSNGSWIPIRNTAWRLYSSQLEAWADFFKGDFFGFFYLFMYDIQNCFICRPSNSTAADAGIEPLTVATTALAVRRSN